MAHLYTKIKLYLEANSKTWDDTKVRLQNDGDGDFTALWTYDISEPTAEQIASYETAGNTEENNNAIRATRKSAYGDIGDQLDEIFKNIDDWKTRIQSIKDANPKG